MKNFCKVIFIPCILVLNISCAHSLQPTEIKLSTEEQYRQYHGASGSSNIKFELNDFVGTWIDPQERDYDFTITKELVLEMDWKKGTCKIIEQTNNILLLKCSGDFTVLKKGGITQTDSQYVRLQIFYFSDSKTSASQRLNITFNQDLDCARLGNVSGTCHEKGKEEKVLWINKNFDMYERK